MHGVPREEGCKKGRACKRCHPKAGHYGEDDIRALFTSLTQGTSTLGLGWEDLEAAATMALDLMEARGMDAASAATVALKLA